MNDASGPPEGGGAYVAPAPSTSPPRSRDRVAEETGAGTPHDLVYCSRSGPPHDAVARARRQRPPRGAGRRRGARPWCWCRSASSPTTWRSSTTSTPRRWRPPSELGLPARRAATAGDRPALRGDGARPAARAGRRRARRGAPERAASASIGPLWDAVPRRLLPQPAGRAPGAVRARLRERRDPGRAAPTSRSRSPARAAALVRTARRGGVDGRRHQDQRHRRRHRGRPRQRGAAPPAARPAAPRRRRPRRGGRRRRRHQRGALDRRPDRRHRELPLRPARSTPSRSRPRSTARSSPGSCSRPDRASSTPPRAAEGATRDGGPLARTRRRAAGRSGSCSPASATTRDVREHQAAAWPPCCRGCATSAGSARARSTCATWPRAAPTATSRRAAPVGLRRRRSGAARGGRPLRAARRAVRPRHGALARSSSWAPASGWDGVRRRAAGGGVRGPRRPDPPWA